MIPIKAQWLNAEGTRVRVEYDNGATSDFPTTEFAYQPWVAVMGYVARGELVIEPYSAPVPLSDEQRRDLGIQ